MRGHVRFETLDEMTLKKTSRMSFYNLTSFPKHIRWWIVINDLNETTHDEFCVRSIRRSANWGMETFISFVAWRRTAKQCILFTRCDCCSSSLINLHSKCLRFGPIISSVVALHTTFARACPAMVFFAANNRSTILCPPGCMFAFASSTERMSFICVRTTVNVQRSRIFYSPADTLINETTSTNRFFARSSVRFVSSNFIFRLAYQKITRGRIRMASREVSKEERRFTWLFERISTPDIRSMEMPGRCTTNLRSRS